MSMSRIPSISQEVERWVHAHLYHGDVLQQYEAWPAPSLIVSDGAYGVGGFHGDPRTPEMLADWYRPHIETWARRSTPATTLWLWNTEVGWATVHPLLVHHGWEHVELNIWDKGVAHVAGNVNGDTIRRFPVVTEVCAFYRRRLELPSPDGTMLPAKRWLRAEWRRSGLALSLANDACGVRSAATRKYLTKDWLWYLPPPEMMQRMVDYAQAHGDPSGRPYFSLDGKHPVTMRAWRALRHPWSHQHGVTNVWSLPHLGGEERFRGNGERSAPRIHNPGRNATNHLNQKPLELMRRIVLAATAEGDVIWEPFGGLCSAAVAAVELGREPYAAELREGHVLAARARLSEALERADPPR
jgi:site-specific DNA-methyltransferase (adenine-specific)